MSGDLLFGIALKFSRHSHSENLPLPSCTSFGFKDALVCCDRKYLFVLLAEQLNLLPINNNVLYAVNISGISSTKVCYILARKFIL